MDPGTGNIYNTDQAKALGLDPEDLIPLDPSEAKAILRQRHEEATQLAERKLTAQLQRVFDKDQRNNADSRAKGRTRAANKTARNSRKRNR